MLMQFSLLVRCHLKKIWTYEFELVESAIYKTKLTLSIFIESTTLPHFKIVLSN